MPHAPVLVFSSLVNILSVETMSAAPHNQRFFAHCNSAFLLYSSKAQRVINKYRRSDPHHEAKTTKRYRIA